MSWEEPESIQSASTEKAAVESLAERLGMTLEAGDHFRPIPMDGDKTKLVFSHVQSAINDCA
jgi:hypothetical protein